MEIVCYIEKIAAEAYGRGSVTESEAVALSQAVSLKRIAEALERLDTRQSTEVRRAWGDF